MAKIKETLEFIEKFKKEHGVAPRQIDIANAFGEDRRNVSQTFAYHKEKLIKYPEYKMMYYS